jgi:hypothetical protein
MLSAAAATDIPVEYTVNGELHTATVPSGNGGFLIEAETTSDGVYGSSAPDITFALRNGDSITVEVGDADPQPQILVSDVVANEEDGALTFEVGYLGPPSASLISLNYATAPAAGMNLFADYDDTSGTLTWLPGETGTKTITVLLHDDDVPELDEFFSLTVSTESDVNLLDDRVFGTILSAEALVL